MTADSLDNQPDKTRVPDSDVPAERRNSDAVPRKPPIHNKPSDAQAGDADSSSLETEDGYGGGTLSPNITFKESSLESTDTGLAQHISDPEILERIEEMLARTQPKKLALLQQDTSFNISPSQLEETQASQSKSTDDKPVSGNKPVVRAKLVSVNTSSSEKEIEASDVELIDNEPTTQNKPPVQREPIVLSEPTGEMDSEASDVELIDNEPATQNNPPVRSKPIPVAKLVNEMDADPSDVELVDEEPSPQNKPSIRVLPIALTGSTEEPSVVEQADSELVDIKSVKSKPAAGNKPTVRSKPVALTERTAQEAKTESSETQPVASKDKQDDGDTVAPAVKVASVSPMVAAIAAANESVAAIASANKSTADSDDDKDDPAAPISEAASVSPMVAAIAATSRSLAETAEPSRDQIAEDQVLIQTGPDTQAQYAPQFDAEPTSSEEPTTASPEPIAVSATTAAIMAPLAHLVASSAAEGAGANKELASLISTGDADDESEDEMAGAWFSTSLMACGITSTVLHTVGLLILALLYLSVETKPDRRDVLVPPAEEIVEEETPEEEQPEVEIPLNETALEDELNQEAEIANEMDDVESPFQSDTELSDVPPTPDTNFSDTLNNLEDSFDEEFLPRRSGGKGDGKKAAGGTGSGKGTGTGTGRGGRGRLGGRSSRRKAYADETHAYSENAVNQSMLWIINHQMRDGGWSFHHHLGACAGRCGNPGEFGQARNAATGLALLPLLGAGHTPDEGPFKANVLGGIAFLLRSQKADGSFWEPGGRMYSHGIATLALCEAYGLLAQGAGAERIYDSERVDKEENKKLSTLDKNSPEAKAIRMKMKAFRMKVARINARKADLAKLRRAATRATAFIIRAQGPDGGWRYNPGDAGDTSVVGWQIAAMFSAQEAGFGFSQKSINGATAFLNSVHSAPAGNAAYGIVGTKYSYQRNKNDTAHEAARPATDAIGLISRVYLGLDARHPGIQAAASRMAAQGPSQSGNMYYNYYATQLMYQSGGDSWKRWNRSIQGYMVGSQAKGGHLSGSWFFPNGDRGAKQGGRLYCTALGALCLEESYRHMRLNEHAAGQFEEKDPALAAPVVAVPVQQAQPNPGAAQPAAPGPRPGGAEPKPNGLQFQPRPGGN